MKTYEIGLEINTKSEDAALRQTEQRLSDIAKKQHEAAAAAEKHSSTLRDLSSAIAGIVGTGAFLSWLQQGTAAAIDQERAMRQLAGMASQFGQDGANAAKAAEALGNALQKVGYDDDEVLSAIQQILPLTRDYEQAISAVSLAYDINATTGKDLGTVMGIMQQLIAGNERGLKLAVRELGIEATTTQGALEELDKTFRGGAAALDDTKAKISAARAELDDLGKLAGGPVADSLVWLINRIKDLGHYVGAVALGWSQFGRAGAAAFGTIWDAVRGKLSVKDIKARFAELRGEFSAEWDAWAEDVEGKMGTGSAPGAGPTAPIRGRTQASGSQSPEAQKKKQTETAITKAAKDGEAERARIGQAALDARARQYEADKQMAQRTEEEKARIGQAALDARARNFYAEQAMEAEAAAVKKELQEEAIAGSIGALASAFPQFKGFAVAEAIISTYQGAAKAIATYPPPYSFIAAAAQIAAGMAHVQKILSTEPGTGGGGGSGGAAASYNVSGRMTTSQPYAGGGGAKSTTNNYNSTSTTHKAGNTQINLTTLTASESARSLTELSKAMPTGERAANRQMATPQRIKIGSNRAN